MSEEQGEEREEVEAEGVGEDAQPTAEAQGEESAEAAPEVDGHADGEAEPEAVAESDEEAAAGDEPEAADDSSGPSSKDDSGKKETAKAKDLPPGADLEPISIEPEVELDAEERARQEAEAEEKAAREAELNRDDAGDEELIAVAGAKELPGDGPIQATGKRKRSVARVLMVPGKGTITVNGRDFEEYFPRARHRTIVSSPLVATGFDDKVEVRVLVHGGGISGQAGAARHGIARGLTEALPELRSELKKRGFLTRDSRAKERRKAGLKKARKRPQFSKR